MLINSLCKAVSRKWMYFYFMSLIFISGCSSPQRIYVLSAWEFEHPMLPDTKFGLLSEEEKNNLIKTVFQQRLKLQIIVDINNYENHTNLNNTEKTEYIQSLLTNFPPNNCEMAMSIRKIDSTYFDNKVLLVTPNIGNYDFYQIHFAGEGGKIDFFCKGNPGSSNYIQLPIFNIDTSIIYYGNYLIAINRNANFDVSSRANEILVPEILFLNKPMLEYDLSEYYLNYLVFHNYELGVESFIKWLKILSYTEYLPKDIKLDSEEKKYYIFKFYSMEKKMTMRAKVYKQYPNAIEYLDK